MTVEKFFKKCKSFDVDYLQLRVELNFGKVEILFEFYTAKLNSFY